MVPVSPLRQSEFCACTSVYFEKLLGQPGPEAPERLVASQSVQVLSHGESEKADVRSCC